MRGAAALVVVLVALCLGAFALPTEIENGRFEGRSGDIVIQAQSTASPATLTFLGSNSPRVDSSTVLKDTQVADLLSHLLGTASLNPEVDRTGFPKRNFFSSPKASVMFVLDADSQSLAAMDSASSVPHQSVASQSFPQDGASILNTILTGASPSKHGIVQNSWFNTKAGLSVNAFESWCPGMSGARSASLQDITGLAHSGRSLVLSFASDLSTSRALATKPFLLKETAQNYGMFFDGSSFATVYPERVMQLDFASPAELLASYPLPSALDQSVEEVAALISEVAFVMALPDRLNSDANLKALVDDSTPDYYSFAFSGLKAIRTKYGASSTEYAAALALVDAAIAKMVNFVESAYPSQTLVSLVALPVPTVPEHLNVIVEKASVTLENMLAVSVDNHFPQLYFAASVTSEQRETACAMLSEVLAGVDAQVYCLPMSDAFAAKSSLSRRQDVAEEEATADDEYSSFQIVLWSAVGLIHLTLAACGLMWTIDASGDTMIYNQHNQINVPTI
eukprot:TRINITY_DN1281_c0_g1_i1.p1 TRINITY_DN1281_c0_g1~~TRINITY_DN1281_c0_g1_i1.p1  ORF type:complete len:536 (-),score=72.89 TRINITY_DN1281_c0_g1_i1:70-1596(-)